MLVAALDEVPASSSDEAFRRRVENMMQEWFKDFDSEYFKSIDSDIADYMGHVFSGESGAGASELEAAKKKISGSASAAIVFVVHNRLFVVSCGTTRALLVSTDESMNVSIEQMNDVHNSENNLEEQRLLNLGIGKNQLTHFHGPTRCFGNYFLKSGYNFNSHFFNAASDLCSVLPGVSGGFKIGGEHHFLLLISDSVFNVIRQSGKTVREVNNYLREKVLTANAEVSCGDVSKKILDQICDDHFLYQTKASAHPAASRDSMAAVCIRLSESQTLPLEVNSAPDASMVSTSPKTTNAALAKSYVNFADYNLHPASDTVQQKVEDVFEEIKRRRRLRKIEEDDH
ncbi:hypothetical protein L596_003315 [Steinernema carpocapsae]|nr:hypothetical protein L596_003315 [Steinernema carpocapsae]